MSQTEAEPRRVLVVAGSEGERVLELARRLPADGLMICIDGDRAAAARATDSFAREGVAARVNVMIGDPLLLLRKVAGPFDLIVTPGGSQSRLARQLESKLAPGGRILDL